MYLFPKIEWNKMTAEEKAEMQKGPSGVMYIRNPATFSFPKTPCCGLLRRDVCSPPTSRGDAGSGHAVLRVFQIAARRDDLRARTNFADAIWYGKPGSRRSSTRSTD
jgi:hypothetical protein